MEALVRLLLVALSFMAAASGLAAETKVFDQATFEALQAADRPILIDVYADWCPTCKQQEPIVSELMQSTEFKDFTVLKVNYDTQKGIRRIFRVTQQSTFIVYRGKNEVARSIGDTAKDSIARTLRNAFAGIPAG